MKLSLTIIALTMLTSTLFAQQSWRDQQKGASFSISTGIAAVDVGYVNELFEEESAIPGSILYGSSILLHNGSSDYSSMFSITPKIMAGFNSGGVRVGFSSTAFGRFYDVDQNGYEMNAGFFSGYGGLVLEKGHLINNHNIVIGGLIGMGGTMVSINSPQLANNYSGTSAFNDSYSEHELEHDIETFEAFVFGLYVASELTLDYSYSFSSWFHLGVTSKITMMNSVNATEAALEDYTTFNPSLGAKIVFGTLG